MVKSIKMFNFLSVSLQIPKVLDNDLAPLAPLVGSGQLPASGDHSVDVLQGLLLPDTPDEVLGQLDSPKDGGLLNKKYNLLGTFLSAQSLVTSIFLQSPGRCSNPLLWLLGHPGEAPLIGHLEGEALNLATNLL